MREITYKRHFGLIWKLSVSVQNNSVVIGIIRIFVSFQNLDQLSDVEYCACYETRDSMIRSALTVLLSQFSFLLKMNNNSLTEALTEVSEKDLTSPMSTRILASVGSMALLTFHHYNHKYIRDSIRF